MNNRLALAFALPVAFLSLGCVQSDAVRDATTDSAGTRTVLMDSLLSAGDSTYRRDAAAAATLWERARDLAATARDSQRLAKAWTGLSQAAMQRGDYPKAESLGVAALALKQRLGMRAELFRSLNTLGLLAYYRDRNAEASRYLVAAAAHANEMGEPGNAAKALLNLGLVHREYGRWAQADSAFANATTHFTALADSVNLGRAANNRAALAIDHGEWQPALQQLQRARAIYASTNDSSGILNALGQSALAYAGLGEPARAFAAIDSAIQLARALGTRSEVIGDLRILGDLFRSAGDHANALESYRSAEALLDSTSTPDLRARLYRGRAQVLLALNEPANATRLLEDALALHVQHQMRHAAFEDRLLLAVAATQSGRVDQARRQLDEANHTLDSLDAPIARSRWLIQRAHLLAAQRRWLDVETTLKGARPVLPALEIEMWALLARSADGRGLRDSAMSRGERVLLLVENLRGQYGSDALVGHFVSRHATLFAEQTLRLLRAGRTADAFAVADRARSQKLRGALQSAQNESRRMASRDAEARALLAQLDVLLARLQDGERQPPAERGAEYATAQLELRDSISAVRAHFEALDARRRASLAGVRASNGLRSEPSDDLTRDPTRDLTRLSRVLDAHELLLAYLVTDEHVLGFAITRDSLWAATLPVRGDALQHRIRLARDLLASRDQAHLATPVLSTLYDLVVRPLLGQAHRQYTQLLILPHGALQQLPFAALHDVRNGRFLVESQAVAVVPDVSTLLSHRVDAAVRIVGHQVSLFAPFAKALRGTQREVETNARWLGAPAPHLDTDADEQVVREALSNAGALHVATHAELDVRSPLFSAVLLDRGTSKTGHDGRLEVREIIALPVRAQLVYLSGCETAAAVPSHLPSTQLDAWTTLAQAWLSSGARTVVATMWRVDDEAAATMATHFYRAQSRNGSATALAQAQRAMLQSPATRSPYFWASHQLIGDSRTWVSPSRGASFTN